MHKLSIIIITTMMCFSLISCRTYTVKAVEPGTALLQDKGYLVVTFTQKQGFFSFGTRKVYMILEQLSTGKLYYIPFGDRPRIHLISVIPGKYLIKDFIYMTGLESTKGVNPIEYGRAVLYSPPEHIKSELVSAQYPKKYIAEFEINQGQIIHLGDYQWERTSGIIKDKDVEIHRVFGDDTELFFKLKKNYPDISEDVDITPLSSEY